MYTCTILLSHICLYAADTGTAPPIATGALIIQSDYQSLFSPSIFRSLFLHTCIIDFGVRRKENMAPSLEEPTAAYIAAPFKPAPNLVAPEPGMYWIT